MMFVGRVLMLGITLVPVTWALLSQHCSLEIHNLVLQFVNLAEEEFQWTGMRCVVGVKRRRERICYVG